AQGYASHKGLGLLLDAGGSDRYRATTAAQGYADADGLGALVEVEGNDNYHNKGQALGATPPGAGGTALFVDLGGHDEYDTPTRAADREALGGATAVDVGTPTLLGGIAAWRTGNGVGVDYLSQDNARGALRNLYAGEWFGVSRTTLTVLRTDETGRACTTPAREVVQGEERVVATGIVCLRAVVDLTQGRDPQPGTRFSVDGVDLLVGGRRFATLNASAAVIDRPGRYSFEAFYDTRGIPDGVAPFSALALVRATFTTPLGEQGAVVFYDQAAESNRGAVVPALVNNPAQTTLKLWPEFDGGADAVFSPTSALPGRNALLVDWNASHDAGEDRYGLKHGWVAPPELSNLPCEDNATRLCDLLPFYLRQGGQTFDTTPVEFLPYSREGTFNQRENDNPYTQRFPNLTTPLTVYKRDAFRLHLNTHQAILPGDYETTLRVVLTNGNGDPIFRRNETGVEVPVVVAERTVVSPQNLGTGPLLRQVLGQHGDTISNALLNASSIAAGGDALRQTAARVHQACQPGGSPIWLVSAPNSHELCGNTYGYLGYGTAKPCQPPGPAIIGYPRLILQTIHDVITGNTEACKPLMDDVNATAARGDGLGGEVVAPLGGAVNDQFQNLLADPNQNPLHWRDFFLDAQQPSLPPGVPAFPEDEETLTIPPGYGLLMEMYISSSGTQGSPDFSSLWRQTVGEAIASVPSHPIARDATLQPAVAGANAQANQTMRDANQASGGRVPNRPQCVQCADNLWNDTVAGTLRGQNDESSSVGAALDRIVKNPIPVAFFQMGDAQGTRGRQMPARLEVRVPTEATTTATIAIEDLATGETVARLEERRVVGDVPGSPTLLGREYLQITRVDPETGETVVVEEHVVYSPRHRGVASAWGAATDDSLR
ncbi:MAG TPA: hypothetical protein VNX21_02595, partial [Candidatus Thermoplasmatota archaeon]|nr:hypothetical protein [Candidatus Thermoplasmatota archaeon]